MIYICTPQQVCKKIRKTENDFHIFFIRMENDFHKESIYLGQMT